MGRRREEDYSNSRRILITSPSLNVVANVSGISSLVSNILKFSRCNIIHFEVGRKDRQKRNVVWLYYQIKLFIQFIYLSIFEYFDILHINTSFEKPSIFRDYFIVAINKKIFRRKVLFHIHGGYYLIHSAKSGIIRFIIKKSIESSDMILVLSEMEKNVLKTRYGHYNYHVLPNAVNGIVIGSERNYMRKGILKLLFLGRINKTKGIYTISESFKYLEKHFDYINFEIYGNGPELDSWMKALKQYPSLNYNYRGVVDEDGKWKVLNETDVFLLPSLHSEGMPIAMIEAMAAGCLVIVTDDASITSVVKNNETGIIIPKNSPQQLANKIIEIFEGVVGLEVIGKSAQTFVKQHLSFSNYIQKLDELYCKL